MKKQTLILFMLSTAMLSYRCETNESIDARSAKLNVRVNITVGNTLYEDTDAPVTLSGYDETGVKRWTEVFQVANSSDEVTVKLGYHHYTIETAKWGIQDRKILSADELWRGRAEGPAPVNHELSGETTAKKLSFYTEFFEDPIMGFKPQQKVKFEYNDDGALIKKIFYGFDPTTQALVELRYLTFAYTNNHVSNITGYFTGSNRPHVEYLYEYLPDNTLSAIHETNHAAGVSSIVNFLYNLETNKVQAAYKYSNGGSFFYEMFLNNKNMVSDRTTKGADVCNTGVYTYDSGINPFSQLGYVEYDLDNYSINNRLTENVNYLACSFPSIVPQTYSYVYDKEGYPIVATTIYKSGSNTGKSQRIFSYK